MCLIVVARPPLCCQGLVVAANRDERHDRPAEALHWWPDRPALAGGRDCRAGGSWLAVRRDGRFAAVLNAPGSAPAGAPSRGSLVVRLLGEEGFAASQLAAEAHRYAGFHALVGDATELTHLASAAPQPRALPGALAACGNTGVEQPGPRVARAQTRIAECLGAADPVPLLFDVLADATEPGAGPGDARPIFIRDSEFGTRCSSVVVLGADGRIGFHERRFDREGHCLGERTLAWPRSGGP